MLIEITNAVRRMVLEAQYPDYAFNENKDAPRVRRTNDDGRELVRFVVRVFPLEGRVFTAVLRAPEPDIPIAIGQDVLTESLRANVYVGNDGKLGVSLVCDAVQGGQ